MGPEPFSAADTAKDDAAQPRGGKRGHSRDARPKVAVDTVLFAIESGRLKCYLVRLTRGLAAGKWAFPGRLVRVGEMLDEAARRELEAATALRNPYLEQLFSFGDPTRDPKAHVVSVAYLALTDDPHAVFARSSRYSAGRWFEVDALPELAYDHALMADYALRRLKGKFEYTNIACHMLPATFTFAQLEELYATVLERALDRRNFRRRILATGLLRRLPGERRGAHRPAALYQFNRRSLQIIEML
ncbi:MAG: NUDIX hydrolase [Candidatus Binataceae bacterium]